MVHLLYLVGTGYYQLYYLLVLLEFYALFPLCLVLVRRTVGHHGLLLLASGLAQVVLVSSMHWGLAPAWMTGYWATREVTSYQFYLIAGMVMALHLDEFHQWLVSHVWTIVARHGRRRGRGRGLVLPLGRPRRLVARLELRPVPADRDPLQRRRHRLHLSGRRGPGQSAPLTARAGPSSPGSDNSYGVYLAQLLFITLLSWLGWSQLNDVLPWPVVSALTVVLVFMACIGLTEVLARTPWSRPLTGRSASRAGPPSHRALRYRTRGRRGRGHPERPGRGAQSDLRSAASAPAITR